MVNKNLGSKFGKINKFGKKKALAITEFIWLDPAFSQFAIAGNTKKI